MDGEGGRRGRIREKTRQKLENEVRTRTKEEKSSQIVKNKNKKTKWEM